MRRSWLAGIFTAALLIAVGCSAETDGVCVDPVPGNNCQPEYEPTFENVYQRTILQRCAIGGGACHLAAGDRGGLTLEGIDVAYDALVTAGRVQASDPECSLLIDRLERRGESGLMPPGNQLSDAERCAVTQWVREGATR
jgi:hypothetical protein